MRNIITLATLAAAMLVAGTASAQDEVKIKKGKATMSEQHYNDLRAKAEAYERLQAENASLGQQLQAATSPQRLRTFNDSASYAIGRDIYRQWAQQQLGINGTMAGEAMRDCAQGRDRFTDQVARPLLQRFQQDFENRQNAGLQQNIEAGQKFMEDISKSKSVYTTKSGLKYRKVKEGNGRRPKATDRVKVHYTGRLIDGTVFDSSVERGEPMTFPLNQVIAGWTEGLQLMDEGSSYILYVPPQLGYGNRATGDIPAGSTLVFEVELLQINP